MKLLRLKIESQEGFRSLPNGFEILFHSLEDLDEMEQFRPFCFAGLNGSGKSNVLEALSSIFYHLEFCVARYRPKSFEQHFQREKSNPDAYTLEYLISDRTSLPGAANMKKVTITKAVGSEPIMKIASNTSWLEPETYGEELISMKPLTSKNQPAPAKHFLPDNIVAYSSGENETLSLPFIKCRLVHYDEYIYAVENGYREYREPENSLIYIDSNMSQAVLLANLIFEEIEVTNGEETKVGALKSFSDEVGIVGLQCFRMNVNLAKIERSKIPQQVLAGYSTFFRKKVDDEIVVVQLLEGAIQNIIKCATSYYKSDDFLALDFYVNSETKKAFREHFTDSFELFQLFRLLYELNAYTISDHTKEEVYKSQEFYTDWKLPELVPKDNIFAFTDFFVLKRLPNSPVPKPLLLKEFSDGEHQFIHTMGICIMLKQRRVLLLLDEPETHFNPSWRAKFIKALSDSIAASSPIPPKTETLSNIEITVLPAPNNLDFYSQKETLLTSHSPFIISDCLPNNVILFERDEAGLLTAKKASELGIDTYGTSVNLLTNRIFKSKDTIGKYVLAKLNSFKEMADKSISKDDLIESINNEFGDSIEKLLLIKELSEKK